MSHKAEVIRRYLRGQSPADIARELNHSQHAVDRYIRDSEVTRPRAEVPAARDSGAREARRVTRAGTRPVDPRV
ncbi:MAG: DUF1670 domain-containing protein [Anaerolineae bacterium]|nr:DUF1670 domain-containing protein [Anaerolineae bacterium]